MDRQDAKTPRIEPEPELDALARCVIEAALEVHRVLGPGYGEMVCRTRSSASRAAGSPTTTAASQALRRQWAQQPTSRGGSSSGLARASPRKMAS